MGRRGRPKGLPRTGGRQKGTPNKATVEVAEKLAALGCDPIEGMALIAMEALSCPTCHGQKRARFSVGMAGPYPDPDNGDEMTCRTCLGTGREPIPAKLRGDMYSELAQYVAPKRKAVEVSGPNGGPQQVETIDRPGKVSRAEWIALRNQELGSA